MAKKKAINERCPLQSDCDRKCEHVGSECNCDYFINNLTFEVEDAAIRNGIVLPKEAEHIDWDSISDSDDFVDDDSVDLSFDPDDTFNDRDVMISVSDSGIVSYLGGSNGYTAKIQDAINRTRSEFMYIGMLLLEVDAYGYYSEAGFSDVYEYAETTFGFKRSSTNNFMRVYRKFGEAMGIQDRFKKFSYSQLVEMCSMNDNQIASCSPEMSVLRLREVKKGSSVQTSGCEDKASSLDQGVQMTSAHYLALELYLSTRFSNKCDFEFCSDFINFVNGSGAAFAVDIKGEGKYPASVMFDDNGVIVYFNFRSARISSACCFYLLQRLAGKVDAEYLSK